jgi:hypothetical protein
MDSIFAYSLFNHKNYFKILGLNTTQKDSYNIMQLNVDLFVPQRPSFSLNLPLFVISKLGQLYNRFAQN